VTVYQRSTRHLANLGDSTASLQFAYGDFTKENNFAALVHGMDYVFHMICTSLPANENAIAEIEENVLPTLRLLEACQQNAVRKVVFISSGGSVYGPGKTDRIPETHPTEPICPYGIHKLGLEKYLHAYWHLYGMDYAVMRLSNPYGERQNPSKPQGVIAAFIARTLSGQPVEIWGDGSIVRDFVYEWDVAKAAVCLADYQGPEKVFNIGSGRGYSLNEVIGIIEQAADRKVNKRMRPGRRQDVPVNILDITKAQQVLGWQPEVDLTEGIKRVVRAWTQKN
jgi:UDP-glucose 4-epimerase